MIVSQESKEGRASVNGKVKSSRVLHTVNLSQEFQASLGYCNVRHGLSISK